MERQENPNPDALVLEAARVIRTSPDLLPSDVDALYDAAEAANVSSDALGELLDAIAEYYDPTETLSPETQKPPATPLQIARRVAPQPSLSTGLVNGLERATELIYPEDFEDQVVKIVESLGSTVVFEITRLVFGEYLPPEMIYDVRVRLKSMAQRGLIIRHKRSGSYRLPPKDY